MRNRLLLAAAVAGALMFADIRLNQMAATRAAAAGVVYPFFWIADLPRRIGEWGRHNLATRSALLEQNADLRRESLLLEARTQQMEALRAENGRLRELLNSSALVEDEVLEAELVGIAPDPARHLVVLNRGAEDGVSVGQVLIDSLGLMGQVVEVAEGHCRVLLLTDASHATPVQVNRNGVRAVAEGVGRLDLLELRHVTGNDDIQVGDLLVSSGLGGRFPVGYPVATVTEVASQPGQPYVRVSAKPEAALNRSRHVLLVLTDRRG